MNSVDNFKVSGLMMSVLKARTSKEMDDQQFDVFLADDGSRNLGRYRPVEYPQFPYPVAQYVSQRLAGSDRDASSHKLVGEYVMKCVRAREENRSNLDTLRWIDKTIASVGLVERKPYVDQAIADFKAANPPRDLMAAVQALEMDSQALAGMTKGR